MTFTTKAVESSGLTNASLTTMRLPWVPVPTGPDLAMILYWPVPNGQVSNMWKTVCRPVWSVDSRWGCHKLAVPLSSGRAL